MDNISIRLFGETNVGRIRSNNEDKFVAAPIWDEESYLAVVIDGVGGYDGGEIAADIAAQTIVRYLREYRNGERESLLREAVNEANNTIYNERSANLQFSNMACVLTACIIDVAKQELYMAHVGDTRLYQYSGGKLQKLSHDHSLVGYREEIGELTEEEAMTHPQRNVINKILGDALHKPGDDFIESATFKITADTAFLLCSDGLSDLLTSREISEVLAMQIPVPQKCRELIDRANDKGGKDNITLVLADIQNVGKPVATIEQFLSEVRPELPKGKPKRLQTIMHNRYLHYFLVFSAGFALCWLLFPFINSPAEAPRYSAQDANTIRVNWAKKGRLDGDRGTGKPDTVKINSHIFLTVNSIASPEPVPFNILDDSVRLVKYTTVIRAYAHNTTH